MSTLLLVRHGETEGPLHDRDRLSARGHDQAAALGRAWIERDVRPTRVYCGPARRHRQTCEGVAAAFRHAGLAWPEPIPLDDLDEYDALALFNHLLPALAARDPLVQAALAEAKANPRAGIRLLEPVGRAWARGEHPHPEVPTFEAFRTRVTRALDAILSAESKGMTVAAFTSAGVVGTATGHLLGLDAERAFGLTVVVRHTSATEILFSEGRRTLQSFNALHAR